MPARAEGVLYAFVTVIGKGDHMAAARCFTREGCLITPDGTAIHGREDVAAIVAQMVARRTEIEVDQLTVREAGDVALVGGRMTMRTAGIEGRPIVQTFDPTAVLHRVEGAWRIAVLAPWTDPGRR